MLYARLTFQIIHLRIGLVLVCFFEDETCGSPGLRGQLRTRFCWPFSAHPADRLARRSPTPPVPSWDKCWDPMAAVWPVPWFASRTRGPATTPTRSPTPRAIFALLT